MDNEPSSTKLTIEIQKLMAKANRRRKIDRNDPAIRGLMVRVDQLAQQRHAAAGSGLTDSGQFAKLLER